MSRRLFTIISVLVVSWFIILPANAQLQNQRSNFSIGVNGGINLSSVSFEPNIKQTSLMGPSFGFTARYISEKYFSMICGIQAEVNYSQRGWKEVFEEDPEKSYQRAMNYIEIPVLAHLAFGKDEGYGARFVVNLGPQIGFLIGENESNNTGGNGNEQYGKMAENNFDYGLLGGAGVEIRTGIGNFLVEGRYYFGLSDFFSSTKKDYFSRSAHSYIGAKVTYLFDLSR